MESRALRPISKAFVAAGTAGAIATACWLLNRFLDDDELKCTDVATSYFNLRATTTFDDYNTTANYQQQQECDADESFALLPVVSESHDEFDEDAMSYTADYFTPHYDVCILSVSVENPFSNVSFNDLRAAVESCDSISDGIQLDKKTRTLSFSNAETSSNDSMLTLSGECGEEQEIQRLQMCSRTQQWLYVRL